MIFFHQKIVYTHLDNLDYDFASRSVNEAKNRPGAILPVFRSRVLLCNRTSAEGSEYINASFVQVSDCVDELSVTVLTSRQWLCWRVVSTWCNLSILKGLQTASVLKLKQTHQGRSWARSSKPVTVSFVLGVTVAAFFLIRAGLYPEQQRSETCTAIKCYYCKTKSWKYSSGNQNKRLMLFMAWRIVQQFVDIWIFESVCYLQGYRSSHGFIITQLPLHNTKKDFWRLVWDHNCPAIVTLIDDDWVRSCCHGNRESSINDMFSFCATL